MFGWGVVKGLGVTLKNFINTYTDDVRYWFGPPFFKSVGNEQAFARRQGPEGAGLFTVEYPEVKLKPPENFRFLPFLVTDYEVPKDSPDFDKAKWLELDRCTSCGICAKVCPPQCIWIVRSSDPETGKPIPQPAEFYIDMDICMNCGYCAEFCPFDAIKMDHDFELSDYEREVGHIHDLERLLKPASYYASIRPTWYAQEEEARRAAEEEKRRKEEEKKRLAAEKAAAKAAATTKGEAGDGDKPQPAAKPKRTPEEIKAQREAMLAKKQQRAGHAGGEAASPVTKLDDLTRIEGIGPKIAALFQEAGIITFAHLAATEVSKLKQILADAGPQFQLADPSTWPEQAKLAATGKWKELEALQDKLKGGRRDE
jgi:NADH-quinone oxidoreductase subunit I